MNLIQVGDGRETMEVHFVLHCWDIGSHAAILCQVTPVPALMLVT